MITIFTDGSSRGNPGPGGWGAIVMYNSSAQNNLGNERHVIELGGREVLTTNNRMELQAAISALEYVKTLFDSGKISSRQAQIENQAQAQIQIKINCDSAYVINGITKWLAGWVKKGWINSQKETVANRDLWEKLAAVVEHIKKINPKDLKKDLKNDMRISWNYVGGHQGIAGNERCDIIATSFADGEDPDMFDGLLNEYPIKDIENLLGSPHAASKSPSSSSSSSRSSARSSPAYSYVSKVDGVVETHKTWQECEKRVKGVSGARFKKSLNAENEKEIMADL